jgi:TatD DNase family protein
METCQEDINTILTNAAKAGIRRILTIGIDLASSKRAVELASTHPGIYATVGIHPHSAEQVNEAACEQLKTLAGMDKVMGYGEIGLDYAKQYAPVAIQRNGFSRQLELARELDLPVVIHDREAHADTLALLREKGPFPAGGVMHCFSGDVSLAGQVLALGFYISIPGIVTFKNATDLQQVVREIPLEHMLLETDGPFLAPVPWRGKRNQPAHLLYTAAKVAALKDISLAEVADQTRRNTEQLFNLPPGNSQ